MEIDRAEKLNSLTREVFEDLVEVGLALRESTEVRAVVLSGRGRAFSAGLTSPRCPGSRRTALQPRRPPRLGLGLQRATGGAVDVGERLGSARALAQKAVHVWSLIEVPVIAGIRAPRSAVGCRSRWVPTSASLARTFSCR